MLRIAVAHCLFLLTAAALAQAPAVPVEFPPEAQALSAQALQAHLTGKEFHVPLADGSWWRLQFQSGGIWAITTNRGHKNDGTWHVEGSQMCSEPKKARASCNEMRLLGDSLYLKRDSGEVVKFEPR
jgi:hypothetical protein